MKLSVKNNKTLATDNETFYKRNRGLKSLKLPAKAVTLFL